MSTAEEVTMTIQSLEISKEDIVLLPDFQATLHLTIRPFCDCGNMNGYKVRIFACHTQDVKIFLSKEGTSWEVEEVDIRPGQEGCYNCTSMEVRIKDLSKYHEGAGDFKKHRIFE